MSYGRETEMTYSEYNLNHILRKNQEICSPFWFDMDMVNEERQKCCLSPWHKDWAATDNLREQLATVIGNFPNSWKSYKNLSQKVTKGVRKGKRFSCELWHVLTRKTKKFVLASLGKHANFSVLVKSIVAIKLALLYKRPHIFFCCN